MKINKAVIVGNDKIISIKCKTNEQDINIEWSVENKIFTGNDAFSTKICEDLNKGKIAKFFHFAIEEKELLHFPDAKVYSLAYGDSEFNYRYHDNVTKKMQYLRDCLNKLNILIKMLYLSKFNSYNTMFENFPALYTCSVMTEQVGSGDKALIKFKEKAKDIWKSLGLLDNEILILDKFILEKGVPAINNDTINEMRVVIDAEDLKILNKIPYSTFKAKYGKEYFYVMEKSLEDKGTIKHNWMPILRAAEKEGVLEVINRRRCFLETLARIKDMSPSSTIKGSITKDSFYKEDTVKKVLKFFKTDSLFANKGLLQYPLDLAKTEDGEKYVRFNWPYINGVMWGELRCYGFIPVKASQASKYPTVVVHGWGAEGPYSHWAFITNEAFKEYFGDKDNLDYLDTNNEFFVPYYGNTFKEAINNGHILKVLGRHNDSMLTIACCDHDWSMASYIVRPGERQALEEVLKHYDLEKIFDNKFLEERFDLSKEPQLNCDYVHEKFLELIAARGYKKVTPQKLKSLGERVASVIICYPGHWGDKYDYRYCQSIGTSWSFENDLIFVREEE